jgi:hypothetical protein
VLVLVILAMLLAGFLTRSPAAQHGTGPGPSATGQPTATGQVGVAWR